MQNRIEKIKRLLKPFSGFVESRDGLAATEFALLTSLFFIPLFFGMLEGSQLLLSNRRMTTATNAVADIVAQSEDVSRDDLDAAMEIGREMLGEQDLTNFTKFRILSVVRDPDDDTQLLVHWSRDKDQDESATGQIYDGISDVERVHPDSSLIVVEMEFEYTSGLTQKVFDNPFTFARNSVRWPRIDFFIQLCNDVENNINCSETPMPNG